jgi:hypothetical protein
MQNFDNTTNFYVFALRPNRGWKLANGNLHDEVAASECADKLRAEGFPVRVTRCDVSVLMSD